VVGEVREADVGGQRRRLRALEQRRKPCDQRQAGEHRRRQLHHVLPPNPGPRAHLRAETPRARRLPPGRYSRAPVVATTTDTEYELVLMLDPDVPDERRDRITDETRQRIESGASLKHDASWGMRKLAYEIRQRTEAEYRVFRFAGDGVVLDDLNHNLRIADGVLRFRIFEVDPRSPAIVPPPTVGGSSASAQRAPRRQEAPAPDAGTVQRREGAPEEGPSAPAAAAPQPGEPAAPDAPAEPGSEPS
jgi:small subunit ribosomal protein S6